jgi:hypothetical protein
VAFGQYMRWKFYNENDGMLTERWPAVFLLADEDVQTAIELVWTAGDVRRAVVFLRVIGADRRIQSGR